MKTLLLSALTVSVCMLTGCHTQPLPVSTSYDTWFKTQQDIAKVLNKYNGGPRFNIAAITGAIYPLGTTFYGTNGVSPDRRCQFAPEDIFTNDLTPWPQIFRGKTFGFDVSVPFNWASAIGVGKAGANLNTQNAFNLKYANLRQVFVYDDTLLSQITNGQCQLSLGDIAACPRPILRGCYVGTLVVSSTNSFDVGANCIVTNVAGLNIKYNANRGFVIEQTNAIPWFGIYTVIQAGTKFLKMTPEEIRETMAHDPDKFALSVDPDKPSKTGLVKIRVIKLAAPSDADAAVLSQVK
jgi:hypothetical protein